MRFPGHFRVQYAAGQGSGITATKDLSQGGMGLASAAGLANGGACAFRVHLLDEDEPLRIGGSVCSVDDAGVHVAFAADGEQSTARIRSVIETQVIPDIEHSLGRSANDTATVAELAGWYREIGRANQALDLYRAAIEMGACDRSFYEHMALFLLEQAHAAGPAGHPLLKELLQVVEAGMKVGPSAILVAARREASELLRAPEGAAASAVSPTPDQAPDATANLSSTALADIEELRRSIRTKREELYRGFSRLIEERSLLKQLEQRFRPDAGARRETERLEPVLDAIRSRLEDLHGAAEPAPSPAQGRSGRTGLRLAAVAIAGGAALVGYALWLTPSVRTKLIPATVTKGAPAPLFAPASAALPAAIATAPMPQASTQVAAASRVRQPTAAERPARKAASTPDSALAPPPASRVETPPRPPQATANGPAQAHLVRGVALLKERKIVLGIGELEAAVAADPQLAQGYLSLGLAYRMVGRAQSSIAAFEQFLRLAPNHKDAVGARAIVEEYRREHP